MLTSDEFRLEICRMIEKRCARLRGKKRDEAAIEFLAGALQAAQLLQPEIYEKLITWAILLVGTRGYSEIQKVLDDA